MLAISTTASAAILRPGNLRCEYRNNPLGIYVSDFAWSKQI